MGRSREGIDCYGLLRLVYQEELGIQLPDYAYHSGTAEGRAVDLTLFDFYKYCHKVALCQRRAYDIVWLRVPVGHDLTLNHVGLCMEGDLVLEALRPCGSVLRPFQRVQERVLGVYRVDMEAFRGQEKEYLPDHPRQESFR